MSFKKWKFPVIIATSAGILTIIRFTVGLENTFLQLGSLYHWIVEKLTYPIPFYSIILSIIGTVFILWILSKVSERSGTIEKTGVLSLNDDCEARYSYFLSKDGVTLNTIRNSQGYTLYCSIHDLRLTKFQLANDWLCPDPECNHQKRVGNHDFIISLIERQIRQQNS